MPKMTEEKALAIANEWMDKQVKETPRIDRFHAATFLAVFSNGDVETKYNGACHAEFKGWCRDKDSVPLAVATLTNYQGDGKHGRHGQAQYRTAHFLCDETIYPYYDWLFNRSPYRNFYKDKDLDRAVNTGNVITPAAMPANWVLAALQAYRHPWDYNGPKNLFFMHELVKRGIPENIAYLYSTFCLFAGTNNKKDNFKYYLSANHHSAHCLVSSDYMSKQYMVNFFKGNIVFKTLPLNKSTRDNRIFSGVQHMFITEHALDVFNRLIRITGKVRGYSRLFDNKKLPVWTKSIEENVNGRFSNMHLKTLSSIDPLATSIKRIHRIKGR